MTRSRATLFLLLTILLLSVATWAVAQTPTTAVEPTVNPASPAEPGAVIPPPAGAEAVPSVAPTPEPTKPPADEGILGGLLKSMGMGSPTTEPAKKEEVAPAAVAENLPAEAPKKEKPEHWTLFNLIPMEWTLPVAETVAGWFGISKVNEEMYNNHGLLHVMIMFFVLCVIIVISITVGGKYRKMLNDPAPKPGVSGGNMLEALVKTVLGMMEEIIGGHDSQKYLPLIGSLALVILFNNLLGLIPGFYTATDNLNTTLSMAVVAWLLYHYFGIKTHGLVKYLDHFLGPLQGKIKWIMAPLMLPIELISHFARVMSLSLRLFGNMFGDHKVFAVFMGLVALPLVYPLPFLALGLLVAIVQTLVFCLLTMVYIGLATAKEH